MGLLLGEQWMSLLVGEQCYCKYVAAVSQKFPEAVVICWQ